ncbi:MAG TPA: hypothetical protein VGU71_22415 [Candidatus Dormibacteraeota bacterium]|nr:hypothetical protein [Candidatus Dormibacteraeota bacterium]
MERKTHQAPRQLSAHVIEGFERRVTAQGGLAHAQGGNLAEIVELRAMARELIGCINWLETELDATREHWKLLEGQMAQEHAR